MLQGACAVSWNDLILRFGGLNNQQDVFKYNPVTQVWTLLDPSSPPFELLQCSCVILPNLNVLVSGFSSVSQTNMYAVYNVTSNTWPLSTVAVGDVTYSTSLLMGTRLITIARLNVIEYYYSSNTNKVLDSQPSFVRPNLAGSIVAPAVWFTGLLVGGNCAGV